VNAYYDPRRDEIVNAEPGSWSLLVMGCLSIGQVFYAINFVLQDIITVEVATMLATNFNTGLLFFVLSIQTEGSS